MERVKNDWLRRVFLPLEGGLPASITETDLARGGLDARLAETDEEDVEAIAGFDCSELISSLLVVVETVVDEEAIA